MKLPHHMSAPPPSTAERIVETALKLFNEHGYSNVASLRIAMALGISPGNLAYHFKSKTDIVLAVFPKLEEELGGDLAGVTQPARPFTAQDAAVHQIEVFRILWKYRFVFNALTQLMQEPDIHRRFMALQDAMIGTTAEMFDTLIANGDMRPIRPPNSTRIMARNQWMIWLSWLRFEHIEHPERETARNAAVHEGMLQGFFNIQPYFDDAFAAEMLAIARRLLPDDEVKPGTRRLARKDLVTRSSGDEQVEDPVGPGAVRGQHRRGTGTGHHPGRASRRGPRR